MEMGALGSGRHTSAQQMVIVLRATIQHLHHPKVRQGVAVYVHTSNDGRRLF